MDCTRLYFLHILSCFINNKKPEQPPDDMDWDLLLQLSDIHCVGGAVWAVLKDSEISITDAACHKLNLAFISAIDVGTKQEIALKTIKNGLDEAHVKHVFMKGSVIREYYPIKELRTMGDIDCLIRDIDRESCHEVMERLGYELAVKGANVWEYNGKLAYVEVHSKIIYQKLFWDIDYVDFFSNVFENSVNSDGCTYEMTPEYHFIYIVVHLAKHLYRVGCGVRMVMDIPVFINHFKDNLDWNVLRDRFTEIKMWDFVKNLLFLCVKYFDCELPGDVYNPNEDIADRFMDYILAAGVFGGYNRDEYAVKFGSDNAAKTGVKKALGKAGTLFALLFPDYDTMCAWYEWFKGKPKWTLPWGWCKRAYLQLRYKNDSIRDKLCGAVYDNEESKEHHEIMSIIGLAK